MPLAQKSWKSTLSFFKRKVDHRIKCQHINHRLRTLIDNILWQPVDMVDTRTPWFGSLLLWQIKDADPTVPLVGFCPSNNNHLEDLIFHLALSRAPNNPWGFTGNDFSSLRARDCRIISLSLGATRNFELRKNWPLWAAKKSVGHVDRSCVSWFSTIHSVELHQ